MKKKILFLMSTFIFVLLFFQSPVTSYASSIEFTEDNGGFSTPSEIIAYDNYLFVCDTDNSRVQIIDQTTLKAFNFGEDGVQDKSTPSPTHIVCDNDEIYLCVGDNKYIKKFDYAGNVQNFYHNSYVSGQSTIRFTKINSLTLDTYGNLYALNIASNLQDSKILKYISNGQDQGYFEALDIQGLTFTENSTLLMSASSDYMFVCQNTKLTVIDSRTYEVISTHNISQTYTDVKIDHLDNLYFLNGQTLTKLNAPAYSTAQTISLDAPYTLFAFNQVSGNTYFVDSSSQTVVKKVVENIDHLSAFTKPTAYLDTTTLLSEKVTIATLTTDTIAYNYPYTLSSNISLSTSDFVIVLDKNTTANSNFYYCLITNKKDYNINVYIHKNHLSIIDQSYGAITEGNYLALTSAYIYKYPTTIKATDGASQGIIYEQAELSAGDKLTVTRRLDAFKDKNGYSFYEIYYNNAYGYVNSNSVASYIADKEPTKIKPNATIQTSDEKDFVNIYVKSGDNYILDKSFVLTNNTRVRLINNFDKTAEYTEIKYVEGDQVKTAFVKTKYIQVDGISFEVVIAILLAVLCVLFTLTLIAVMRKNKKTTR